MMQQTEEWLELRRSKLGASDAPVIMQVSPWKTPLQLWEEKIGLRKNEFKTSSMQRGLDMEEEARNKFQEATGLSVKADIAFHPKISWMMASLDGIDDSRKNIVEIKCVNRNDHAQALSGSIPEKYFPQVQHQLAVCELEMAYYFSYSPDNFALIQVYRDDSFINKMIKKETEFWECIQDFVPPPLMERDYILKDDPQWSEAASRWIFASQKLKDLEKEEKLAREELLSLSQNQNVMGSGIKLTRMLRKGNVEYNKIPELEAVNLEVYRKKPVEYWRIGEC